HDGLAVDVQPPLDQSGRFARQLLFLPQTPQLPLPQGVAQKNKDDLRGNDIERAGVEIAQVVKAFQEPVAFLNGGPQLVLFLGAVDALQPDGYTALWDGLYL